MDMNGAGIRTAMAVSVVLGLISLVLYILCKRCWWQPSSLARLLRSRGFTVLPYTPIVGNSLENGRLQKLAYSTPLCTGSSHHRYLTRIWPFHFANCSPSSDADKSAIFWLGPRPSLNIVNSHDAKVILSSNYKEYVKFPTLQIVFQRVFGRSILTIDGEEWAQRRRILNPAFASDKLKAMGAQMLVCIQEMLDDWERKVLETNAATGELELDMIKEFTKVSADVLSRTCFGSNFKEGKAVFEDQEGLIEAIYQDAVRYAIIPLYRFLPTARNRLCWKLQRRIHETLKTIIENRMHAVQKCQADSYGDDLLGRILAANGSSLGDGVVLTTQDIIDECRTFFFAGHETTASLLAWATMLMASNPEWQDRAREEVLEMRNDGYINAHSKLKILEMILLETLRLYPPITQLISRTRSPEYGTTDEASTEERKLNIPAGVRINVLCGVMHRDKKMWGDDVDEFQPERFANGISRACKGMHGFMAFGYGPHSCIGQTFAMLEAKLVLASMLQRFRFRLPETYQHAPRLYGTLRPQHGMPLLITPIHFSETDKWVTM
ncbi:hypothetical protein KP509_11G002800 [Ceratopteris richardii]|uniref:Cytochrome P450 n=1 Tax=Ceratopteris richardii TaxID=49495 RepID=A0A8T2TRB7_CERRI|nr:hypothetical protein KP509_11G002800 [Ceratopteris richardii]